MGGFEPECDGIECQGKEEVADDGLDGVRDRIVVLSDTVGEQHADTVAGDAAPSTSHVAEARDEEEVDAEEYGTSNGGHDGAPPGLADEFVPEREVEVDAHEDFGHHDDGDDAEALPVVAADDVFEQIDVGDDDEESEECEHDKILHDQGLAFLALGVTAVAEDKRLVGVAEGLSDHGHNHGNLDTAAVDAELDLALVAGDDEGVADFVGDLVEDAYDAEEEQGPGVGKHFFEQRAVDTVAEMAQFGDEGEGDRGGADEVGEEDVTYEVVGVVPGHEGGESAGESGRPKEEEEVEGDIADDEEEFEGGEFPGAAFEAEETEEDGLEGVDCDDTSHHADILGMGGHSQGSGDGGDEATDGGKKERGHYSYRREGGAEDLAGLLFALVGEVEESGFHTKSKDYQQERGVGVDFGDGAVAAGDGGNLVGVEGHEQIVEETPDDAAEAIDDSIGKKLFKV